MSHRNLFAVALTSLGLVTACSSSDAVHERAARATESVSVSDLPLVAIDGTNCTAILIASKLAITSQECVVGNPAPTTFAVTTVGEAIPRHSTATRLLPPPPRGIPSASYVALLQLTDPIPFGAYPKIGTAQSRLGVQVECYSADAGRVTVIIDALSYTEFGAIFQHVDAVNPGAACFYSPNQGFSDDLFAVAAGYGSVLVDLSDLEVNGWIHRYLDRYLDCAERQCGVVYVGGTPFTCGQCGSGQSCDENGQCQIGGTDDCCLTNSCGRNVLCQPN